MQIQVGNSDHFLRRSGVDFGGGHVRNADDAAVGSYQTRDEFPTMMSNDTAPSHGRTLFGSSIQVQTLELTAVAWRGGQSHGMYAYERIRRTVSAQSQYSAAVSGKSDTLAGMTRLSAWLRPQPNTLCELRFSFSLSAQNANSAVA
jgi:hypothetical protein